MKRGQFAGLFLASALWATTAFAAGYADMVVQQLQADGYSNIVVESTWLGRIRITAVSADGAREIILNPSTGEILRDLWLAGNGAAGGVPIMRSVVTTPGTTTGTTTTGTTTGGTTGTGTVDDVDEDEDEPEAEEPEKEDEPENDSEDDSDED